MAALVQLRSVLREYLVSNLGWIARVVAELAVEPSNCLIPALNKQLHVRRLRVCCDGRLIDLNPLSASINQVTNLWPDHLFDEVEQELSLGLLLLFLETQPGSSAGVVAAEGPVDQRVASSDRDLQLSLSVLLDVEEFSEIDRMFAVDLGLGDSLVEVFVIERLDMT